MLVNALGNPVSLFLDSNGQPLQGGSIYIGQPNTDPTNSANQITVYQDQGLSIPLQQPIKTTNGQPSLNGQQIPVYLGVGVTTYSLAALNAGGVVVMSQPSVAPFSLGGSAGGSMIVKEFISDILPNPGGLPTFTAGVTTSLPLSTNPGSGTNAFVDFDAAPQHYPDDFTVNSSNLVFSSPIPVGVQKVFTKVGTTNAIGTPGAGTVTDASVAANAAIQSSKLAFLQGGAGAVSRTLQSKLREIVSVTDFGAVGDGVTDNTAALAAAAAYVQTNAQQIELVFPQGIYVYATSPNWAINHSKITAQGEVRLRYTGTGNAVTLDAGSGSQNIYDVTFGTPGNAFIIEATNSGVQNACFVRAVHHSTIAIKPRSANTATGAGLSVNFAVCTSFYVTCSVNEDGGFYNSLTPQYGIYCTQRNAGEAVSYCNFYSPIIEGPNNGIYLDYCDGCTFVSGTAEDCQDGIVETAHAIGNLFINMDMESNSVADISSASLQSVYYRCDTAKLVSITGNDIKIDGGLHSQINIGGAALFARLRDLRYNRNNNGSTIADSGTLTTKSGTVNYGTGALDGPASAFAITPSAFTYTNNRVGNVGVAMTGGTVTSVTLTRGGTGTAVYSGASLGSGIFETSPGDVLTWTGTPSTVNGYPRIGI